MKESNLITILGPTASGKTRLAAHLAHQIGGEVISADSRQVYRQMNIGTGKDFDEYTIESQFIKYHLIDILDAGENYNLYEFQQDFGRVYSEINQRQATPVLCGGSGLYIQAILQEYELGQINLKSKNNKLQLGIVFGLLLPVELRRERITKRLHERLQAGMIDEVKQLIAGGVSPEKLIYYGLEYKFITQYLIGELDYKTMVDRLNIAIHQFAKRQMTYFRKMEKDGIAITWIDATLPLEEQMTEIITKMR